MFVAAFAAVNIVYWQDPWLWRNYVQFLTSGSRDAPELLTPEEPVSGSRGGELPRANSETRVLSDVTLESMRSYAREFGSHALIVIHRGVIQEEWYADHWDRDWLTQSQSMHKSLIGILIGIAIDEGRIESVGDPVERYLTEWRDDPRGAITIEQMLLMRSGLSQYPFTANPFSDGIKWLNSGRSIEPILRVPMSASAPGQTFDYNNLNSELLGQILERVYAKRYASILGEKLWVPIGADRARVHTDQPGGRAFTSCCLAAPAMDWARVGLLLLNRGELDGKRVVSANWIDQMVRTRNSSPYYGYHIWLGYNDPALPPNGAGSTGAIASEPFDARDTYLTWGRGQQHVWVVPSREVVIVRLGPALGRMPIEPGFDVTFFVNAVIRDLDRRAR